MAYQKIISVCIIILLSSAAHSVRIGITHWNDVSGQMQSFVRGTSNSSLAPTACPAGNELECIGGLTSLVHWIHDRSFFDGIPFQNVFRLTSGNFAGGESGWLQSIGDESSGWRLFGQAYLNHFNPHVAALGVKDFGGSLEKTRLLTSYNSSEEVNSIRVTTANACNPPPQSSEAEEILFCEKVPKYRVIGFLDEDFVRYEIPVIGFVNPLVDRLGMPGNLRFATAVDAIKEQVNQLPASQKKTVIALGDGTLQTAQHILDEVPEVKLVIFGSGFGHPDIGSYPLKYKQGFIVTAGHYGSSIGKLILDVDTRTGEIQVEGKLIETSRPPVWNDEAQKAMSTLNSMRISVLSEQSKHLGFTRVKLQTSDKSCWRRECNMGNLVTDAMVHCLNQRVLTPTAFPVYSIWHSGAFQQEPIAAGSNVSAFDVHKWLPYHNKAHLVVVDGVDLKRVFEESAKGIDPVASGAHEWGQLLQVSKEIQVYYDTVNNVPQLRKVRMLRENGDGVPEFADLNDDGRYYLVIPSFLREGRGVYEFAKGIWRDIALPGLPDADFALDDTCVEEFIRSLKQISTGLQDRIRIDFAAQC